MIEEVTVGCYYITSSGLRAFVGYEANRHLDYRFIGHVNERNGALTPMVWDIKGRCGCLNKDYKLQSKESE